MRNYRNCSNRVTKARKALYREGKATFKAGLGMVPKLGTALSVYDTAYGAARTVNAAAKYGHALKQQATRNVKRKIYKTTKPIKNGLDKINKLLR
jgi:hypothetical protein